MPVCLFVWGVVIIVIIVVVVVLLLLLSSITLKQLSWCVPMLINFTGKTRHRSEICFTHANNLFQHICPFFLPGTLKLLFFCFVFCFVFSFLVAGTKARLLRKRFLLLSFG